MFRRNRFSQPRSSVFFRAWFAFCFLAAIAILGVYVWIGAAVVEHAQDPEALGEYFGTVVKGFNEASK